MSSSAAIARPLVLIVIPVFNGSNYLGQAIRKRLGAHTHTRTAKFLSLATVSFGEVSPIYQEANALVFPSRSESFDQPLIEVADNELPIVRSELNFVRHAATPVETLDTATRIFILRAIRRLMRQPKHPVAICSGATLVDEVLK